MGSGRRILRYILVLGFLTLLAGAVALGLLYRTFTADLPNIATLQDYRPRIVTKVYSEEGNVIGEFFIEKRELVPMDSVPKVLHDAIIAAEDANFCLHWGFDLAAIREVIEEFANSRVMRSPSRAMISPVSGSATR